MTTSILRSCFGLLIGISTLCSVLAQDKTSFHFGVKEVKTFEPKSGVICLVKKDSTVVREMRSDEMGDVYFQLPADNQYRILFIQPGYESKKYDMDTRKLKGISVDLDVEMIPNNWIVYKGSFHNRKADKFIPLTKVKIKNLYTGAEDFEYTNEEGLLYYYMPPRQKFEITTMTDAFLNKRAIVNTDCGKGEEIKFCLSGFNFENFVDADYQPKTLIGTMMLDSIKVGQSFSFNMFYDAGSANIRPETAKVLEFLASMMQDNPQLEIEIAAHTDSRGDATANQKLSEERAETAVGFLVMKGVKRERMTPKGYGEKYPVNECKDGVPCSEEQYQENRRIDVKILRLTEQYLLNGK